MPDSPLTVSLELVASTVTIHLQGELDASTAGLVDAVARQELAGRTVVVRPDGLTLVDSAGLGALLRLARDVTERDGALVIEEAPPFLDRLLDITGLADLRTGWTKETS